MSSVGNLNLQDYGKEAGSTENGATLIIVLVFLSIAFYNVLELTFMTFATFRKWSGLYFWSFLVATWGIAVYSMGFLLKDTHLSQQYLLYITFIEVGWSSMVTGQSVVLYSRLHLVLCSPKKLRMVLWMIIIDAIIFHIPIIVVAYGANSPNPGPFVVPYSVYEKVQVTGFFIQELILSGIYIGETIKMMKLDTGTGLGGGRARKLMKHLIVINVIIVLLDITILGLEYASLFTLQTAYKGLVYSVKLKLEFSILNRLVEMTSTRGDSGVHSSMARSRVGNRNKEGIVMDTFDRLGGDRMRRMHDVESEGAIGYHAFIHTGHRTASGAPALDLRRGVTRTTEVVINHTTDGDSDSGDAKSATFDHDLNPRGLNMPRKTGRLSISSSEVHFAKS